MFAFQDHLTIILRQRSHLRLWLVFVVPQRPSLTQEGTAFQIIFSMLAIYVYKLTQKFQLLLELC